MSDSFAASDALRLDNFMTSEELDIRDDEHAALSGVLLKLEAGELIHFRDIDGDSYPQYGFNMLHWSLTDGPGDNCGSVGCIGGWAHKLYKVDLDRYGIPDSLYNLMYPVNSETDWTTITPAQAAVAVRNYLTTGKASWVEILGM